MPPLQLTSLLHKTLPHLSVNGRALLSALGCVNGRPTSISELAQWLGFHDRYQLARALKREGLPPLETLGGWTRTLYWIIESQTSGATLRELARRERLDPAVAYRLVRRITGRRWSEIRHAGLQETLLSFREHCRRCAGAARIRHAPSPVRPGSAHAPKTRGTPPKLDIQWGQQIAAIHVGGHPLGAVLSNDGKTLYASTNRDRIVALSLSRQTIVAEIPIPHGSPQLCRHPSGRRLYASGWRSGVVAEIEVPALRLLRTFDLGGVVQEVTVTADGQGLYAANEAGWLDVVHLPTGKRSATLKLGTAALGLALSADDRDVIVGLLHAGKVLIIDRHTLELRTTLDTGGMPRLIAAHGNGPVLVANEAGWVDWIH